jgi:hypothetical protein
MKDIERVFESVKGKIYEEGFTTFYYERKEWVERLALLLRRNSESGLRLLKRELDNSSPLLSFSDENLSFIIDILKDSERDVKERIVLASDLSGDTVGNTAHLLYLIYPKHYPPVPKAIGNEMVTVEEYYSWKKRAEKFLGNLVDNYIMFESAFLFKPSPKISEGIEEFFKGLSFINVKGIKKAREEYKKLKGKQKERVVRFLNDSYVKKVVTSKRVSPVVIDGSNIVFSQQPFPDIARLDKLFNFMGRAKEALFPYRIVFDANIRYIIRGYQQSQLEKWLVLPNVELYSPADDRIIMLARSLKAKVISYDRFLEHNTSGIKILRPEDLL